MEDPFLCSHKTRVIGGSQGFHSLVIFSASVPLFGGTKQHGNGLAGSEDWDPARLWGWLPDKNSSCTLPQNIEVGCGLCTSVLPNSWKLWGLSPNRLRGGVRFHDQGSTRVPPGFHEVLRGLRGGASTKKRTACCWGYHLSLFDSGSAHATKSVKIGFALRK